MNCFDLTSCRLFYLWGKIGSILDFLGKIGYWIYGVFSCYIQQYSLSTSAFFRPRPSASNEKCFGFRTILLNITLKHTVYPLDILMYIHAQVIYVWAWKYLRKKLASIVVVVIVIILTLRAHLTAFAASQRDTVRYQAKIGNVQN